MTTSMQFLRQHVKLIALLAPLVAFFLLPSVISHEAVQLPERVSVIEGQGFLTLVGARVLIMLAIIAAFRKVYLADFPLQIDPWGFIVGVAGGFLWIGICALGIEQHLLAVLGQSEDLLGARSSVNPFELYDDFGTRNLFFTLRFTLLVIAVPIAEELFLRGFFMRAIDASDWQDLSLREMSMTGLAAGTLYGVLTHPSEFVAAAVWFTLVTVMMVRTNKFWNCVLAHAITNLMLGVYLCATGAWHLW